MKTFKVGPYRTRFRLTHSQGLVQGSLRCYYLCCTCSVDELKISAFSAIFHREYINLRKKWKNLILIGSLYPGVLQPYIG